MVYINTTYCNKSNR